MTQDVDAPVETTAAGEGGEACAASVTVDRDGTVRDLTGAAAALLGGEAGELVGRPLASLVAPGDRERLAGELALGLNSGVLHTQVEISVGAERVLVDLQGRRLAGGGMVLMLRERGGVDESWRGRLLLEHGVRVTQASGPAEVWASVWDAVRARLGEAVALRVYRGDEAAIRLEWSSDLPAGTRVVLTVRGWGSRLLAMLEDPTRFKGFAERFEGETRRDLARFLRVVSGRGHPLLLDDPDKQLRAFLTEEELETVRRYRPPGGSPGQEILCPLLEEGRIELAVLVVGPPGKHPFTWDHAAEVWELVLLAHEVIRRQELEARAGQYGELSRLYGDALAEMARAEELETLYSRVGGDLLRGTGANGLAVLAGRRTIQVERSQGLDETTCEELRLVVESITGVSREPGRPVFLESTGADELVASLGVPLRGVGAMAVVPAYLGGSRLATMVLTWPRPRDFSPAERALVEFLGVGLALAVSNHQLRRKLGRLRERVRRIAGVVGHGLLELDDAGRIQFVNPLAVRLLGIADVEARGKALLSVVDPQVRTGIAPVLERVLRGEEAPPTVISAGGRRMRVQVAVETGEGDGEGPLSTWAVVEETEMEQRRARLERLVAASSEIIIDLAPDGTVLGANGAGRRFLVQLGVLGEGDPERSRSKDAWHVLHGEDAAALRRGETVRKEGELLRPGDRPLVWEAVFHPVEGAGDLRILAVVHDRTERHALTVARSTLQRIWESVLALGESVAEVGATLERSHDMATAVMLRANATEPAAGERRESGQAMAGLVATAEKVTGAAAADRQAILEMEKQLDDLRATLQGVGGLTGRSAWIITDQPWRADAVVGELERTGWSCRVAPPNDSMSRELLPEPGLVVLDVGSLTTAAGLYGTIREEHPESGIVLAAPLGGVVAEGLSEDPRLRIVDVIPSGPRLQELVRQVTSP